MTEQHPITPPPELVRKWQGEWHSSLKITLFQWLANCAAQWGADQELEACLGDVRFLSSKAFAGRVRAARRPKPLSLKDQALEALSEMEDECLMVTHAATIRQALEQLND